MPFAELRIVVSYESHRQCAPGSEHVCGETTSTTRAAVTAALRADRAPKSGITCPAAQVPRRRRSTSAGSAPAPIGVRALAFAVATSSRSVADLSKSPKVLRWACGAVRGPAADTSRPTARCLPIGCVSLLAAGVDTRYVSFVRHQTAWPDARHPRHGLSLAMPHWTSGEIARWRWAGAGVPTRGPRSAILPAPPAGLPSAGAGPPRLC